VRNDLAVVAEDHLGGGLAPTQGEGAGIFVFSEAIVLPGSLQTTTALRSYLEPVSETSRLVGLALPF